MDKATIKLIEKLENLLKKEAHIPLANRLLGEQTAEIVAHSWLNQSWHGIVHADLVEEGDKLHTHRILNNILKEGLPELDANLRKNVYAPLILDLVEQEHQELLDHGQMDALYLFEMALELSRIEKGTAVYVHLLNMIAFHQNEFGTLEQLRSESHPREVTKETHLEEKAPEDMTAEERARKQDLEGFVYHEPSPDAPQKVHDSVVQRWLAFENQISMKVTCLLNDSKRMKTIKMDLWQKQQAAEHILEYTEENCEDPDALQIFKQDLAVKRPQFRSGMGKKIASNPNLAVKVYNILDILADKEISAFDYLDVAVALAKANHDTAISMIECDLKNDGDLFISSQEIIRSLKQA